MVRKRDTDLFYLFSLLVNFSLLFWFGYVEYTKLITRHFIFFYPGRVGYIVIVAMMTRADLSRADLNTFCDLQISRNCGSFKQNATFINIRRKLLQLIRTAVMMYGAHVQGHVFVYLYTTLLGVSQSHFRVLTSTARNAFIAYLQQNYQSNIMQYMH